MPVRTSFHHARARSSGLALFTLAGILWGTGGLAGSLLASRAGLHPVAVAAHRLILGGVLITGYALVSGRLRTVRPGRASLVRVAGTGALLAVFQAAYFAAVAAMSVGLATLTTMVAVPVLVTAGSAVLDRVRPGLPACVAVAIAVLGLVLLLGAPGGPGGNRVTGTVFALVAAVGFAVLTLDPRPDLPGLDRIALAGFGFLAGGLFLLPAGIVTGMAVPLRGDTVGAVVFLAVVPTAVPYVAYFAALGRGRPGGAVAAVLLEPLTATVLAAAISGEPLAGTRLVGGALVLASIVPASITSRRAGEARG